MGQSCSLCVVHPLSDSCLCLLQPPQMDELDDTLEACELACGDLVVVQFKHPASHAATQHALTLRASSQGLTSKNPAAAAAAAAALAAMAAAAAANGTTPRAAAAAGDSTSGDVVMSDADGSEGEGEGEESGTEAVEGDTEGRGPIQVKLVHPRWFNRWIKDEKRSKRIHFRPLPAAGGEEGEASSASGGQKKKQEEEGHGERVLRLHESTPFDEWCERLASALGEDVDPKKLRFTKHTYFK